MKLSDELKSHKCGGCRTRVVTRSEFKRWIQKAEVLEARLEELEAGDASESGRP